MSVNKSSKTTDVKALSSHMFAFKILRILRLHHSIGQSSPSANLDSREVENSMGEGVGKCIQRGKEYKSVALCLVHSHLIAKSWRETEAWALRRVIRF